MSHAPAPRPTARLTPYIVHLTSNTLHCARPQEVRPYVDYLDVAVVAPGVVAALLMLLAACCSLRSRGWPCCPCGPCKRRRDVGRYGGDIGEI